MCELSVIVPVYNSEKYLSECITSILNQTFQDFELILVNDGSTDDSGSICDEFATKYDNVRCMHIANSGAFNARKVGVLNANGKYVGFIDSDDTIDKDFYKTLMGVALLHNVDVVSSGYTIEDVNYYDDYIPGKYDNSTLGSIYETMIFDIHKRRNGMLCSLCTKVIKKSLYERVILDTECNVRLWEDLSYVYKIIIAAKDIYVLDYSGYYYRQNKNSTSKKYNTNNFIDTAKSFENALVQHQNCFSCIQKQIRYLYAITLYIELIKMLDATNNIFSFIRTVKKNKVEIILKKILSEIDKDILFKEHELKILELIISGEIISCYYKRRKTVLLEKMYLTYLKMKEYL